MNSFAPSLNTAAFTRKTKGLIKLFGGLAAPFYWADTVLAEGTPVKIDTTAQDKIVASGSGDGPGTIGLAMQMTYDESAFGQLKGYHFANDTRARLGQPIGVLMGCGFALTNYYVGSPAYGDQAYLNLLTSGSSSAGTGTSGAYAAADAGKLTPAAGLQANKLPVIFEGASTWAAGTRTLIRIRYGFAPTAAIVVAAS